MLNVSIVLYKHLWSNVESLIQTLLATDFIYKIYIIDNSPTPSVEFNQPGLCYFFTGKNLGYGTAHNIALRESILNKVPYHLVVNPDISFDASILKTITLFMDSHLTVGHLMPKVLYPNGELQYLCKLLPTPADLLFRRFLPESWNKKRMQVFEMRDTGYSKIMDVPYLSGCFMFLRTAALAKVGIFDERFFLYPEDIDLTRRIGQHYRTVFFPDATVIHHHAKSSYKNINMMLIHSWNLIKYFNKWGWIFDKERKAINHKRSKK